MMIIEDVTKLYDFMNNIYVYELPTYHVLCWKIKLFYTGDELKAIKMASNLPEFRKFAVEGEPSSIGVRWKLWLSEFDNVLLALAITDPKRQRSLMLYYETFTDAKKRLSDYF